MKTRLPYGVIAGLVSTIAVIGCGGTSDAPTQNTKSNPPPAAALQESNVMLVTLPSKDAQGLAQFLSDVQNPDSKEYQHFLSPSERMQRFGPAEDVRSKVNALLQQHGFAVLNPDSDTITIDKSQHSDAEIAQLATGLKAVGVDVAKLTLGRTRTHSTKVGSIVNSAITAASMPNFGTQVDIAYNPDLDAIPNAASGGNYGGYFGHHLKQVYHAPSHQAYTGAGRTIGIIMSGDVSDADTATYFQYQNLPAPKVQRVYIGFPANWNHANDVNLGGATEAALDVQMAGGMAPGAKIILYVIPNLADHNILDAVNRVVSDNKADIVSMSFGACEKFYTAAYNEGVDYTSGIKALDAAFQRGNAQGITFVASSGDQGGVQCPSVSYFYGNPATWGPGGSTPATSPAVTGVGGTNLGVVSSSGSYMRPAVYASENAYGDALQPNDPYSIGVPVSGGYWGSGGGESVIYSKPTWQYAANTGTKNRASPDLSLHMGGCPGGTLTPCPAQRSWVWTRYLGSWQGSIGTSASAPNFAGVLALMGQAQNRRFGNINPLIYTLSSAQKSLRGVFRRDIPGNNGMYASGTTAYNMNIGNGTIDILQFMRAPGLIPAGNPGTMSNPAGVH